MRLKIGSKVYPEMTLDSVTLRDIILFDSEVRDLRADLNWTWADVERVSEEVQALSDEEANRHPERYFFLATMVWAVRRLHDDEPVTFSEAIDVDPTKISFIQEPEDRKPGKAKGAKKPRKASAPAGKPQEADAEQPTPPQQDSESPSTTE